MNDLDALVEFWKDYPYENNVHPNDLQTPQNFGERLDMRGLNPVNAFFNQQHMTNSPYLDLLPVPYMGNLKEADIFLLMRNPGLSKKTGYMDYGTNHCTEFKDALCRNIRQTDDNQACIAFDPQFWWSSWFIYYEKLLSSAIHGYSKKNGKTYLENLQEFSRRVAIIELAPYYSASAGWLPLPHGLPSMNKARNAARCLQPRAGEKDTGDCEVGD